MERRGRSHYDVLGVSPYASGEEIRRAFRGLALRYHPDVYSGVDAEPRFREIADAYGVLHDPMTRARYDRSSAGESKLIRVRPGFESRDGGMRRRDDVPRFLDEQLQQWTVVIAIGFGRG